MSDDQVFRLVVYLINPAGMAYRERKKRQSRQGLSAFLLDLNDPTRVIGRLREPLLAPNEAEREGYVPNVVYTCGALPHGRELVTFIAFASTPPLSSTCLRSGGGVPDFIETREAFDGVALEVGVNRGTPLQSGFTFEQQRFDFGEIPQTRIRLKGSVGHRLHQLGSAQAAAHFGQLPGELLQEVKVSRRPGHDRFVVEVVLDVRRNAISRLVTARALLLQALHHDPIQIAGQLRDDLHYGADAR